MSFGGVLLMATGIGTFYGEAWARCSGIVLSLLAIVWNVGWAEAQPTQALIGALLFISVVFSLATHSVKVDRGEP